ncbi:RTC4-like domain-containing protein [Sporodiniella umbellata]|nr:RTC4-like domain-containing protein [Sporodiniella umbellata]
MSQERAAEKKRVADYDPKLFKDIFGSQVKTQETVKAVAPIKRTSRTMAMPKKRIRVETKAPTEAIEELQRTVKEEKVNSFDCPVCFESLLPPYPEGLSSAIKTLEEKRRVWRESQKRSYDSKVAKEKAEGKVYIEPMLQTSPDLPSEDLKSFCYTHRLELVWKPMAKSQGYPDPVDFEILSSRIEGQRHVLLDIIQGQKESGCFTKAKQRVQQLGSHKAKGAKELIHQFEQTLPGYYGLKGMEEMMRVLATMFLDKELDRKASNPLEPLEYIQQVLVPECALRLIQEDMGVDMKKAKRIMEESIDYGKRYSL